MIAVTLAGVASYFSLGRAEDPPFTFRTMIVQAAWPGATMDDTLQQVTERIERKLQETRGLDFLRSYTMPGRTTIFVNLKGSTPPRTCRTSGIRCARTSATSARPCRAGVVGPGFNDDFGDTFGLIYGFTADGFTPARIARLCRGYPLAASAGPGRVEDRASRRAGRADLCRVLHQAACGSRHRPGGADRGAESPERGRARGRARDGE